MGSFGRVSKFVVDGLLRGSAFLCAGLIAVLGWVALSNLMVVALARGQIEDRLENIEWAEVAIILGAGPATPTLHARLDAGLELYRAGKVRLLLVSGGSDGTGYGETEFMWRYLRQHGVPPNAIVVDSLGVRTLDSVRRAKSVFGFSEVVVVTQRYHCYRAVFLAHAFGVGVQGFAATSVDSSEYRFSQRRELAARVMAIYDVVSRRSARYGDQPPALSNHPAG